MVRPARRPGLGRAAGRSRGRVPAADLPARGRRGGPAIRRRLDDGRRSLAAQEKLLCFRDRHLGGDCGSRRHAVARGGGRRNPRQPPAVGIDHAHSRCGVLRERNRLPMSSRVCLPTRARRGRAAARSRSPGTGDPHPRGGEQHRCRGRRRRSVGAVVGYLRAAVRQRPSSRLVSAPRSAASSSATAAEIRCPTSSSSRC